MKKNIHTVYTYFVENLPREIKRGKNSITYPELSSTTRKGIKHKTQICFLPSIQSHFARNKREQNTLRPSLYNSKTDLGGGIDGKVKKTEENLSSKALYHRDKSQLSSMAVDREIEERFPRKRYRDETSGDLCFAFFCAPRNVPDLTILV